MNDVSLRRLGYFATLAQTEHFGRAAEELHISQPALSSEIKKLEAQLGLTLFTRSPRTALTREGRLLHRRAQHLLAAADRFSLGAQALAEGISGTVTIGCVQTFFMRGLPQAVTTIERQWPQIRIQILEMTTAEQIEQLETGGIDIACGHTRPTSDDLTSHKIASDSFRLCTHPASGVESLTDAASEPFVIFRREASPHYWERVMSICRAADFTPHIKHQTTTWSAVISLVRQGLGVSIVPDIVADDSAGIVSLGLDDPNATSASWMTMRDTDAVSTPGRVFDELKKMLTAP